MMNTLISKAQILADAIDPLKLRLINQKGDIDFLAGGC